MAIEVLGRTIMEQNKELDKRQEEINKLNKRIKLFEDYVNVYEECLKRGGSIYDNKN